MAIHLYGEPDCGVEESVGSALDSSEVTASSILERCESGPRTPKSDSG